MGYIKERHSYVENSIGLREILIVGLVRWRSGGVVFCIDDEFRYVGRLIQSMPPLEGSLGNREGLVPL